MLGTLLKLGLSGCLGFLAGLLGVWWVEPTTTEGTVLILAVCIAVAIAIERIVALVRGRQGAAGSDD